MSLENKGCLFFVGKMCTPFLNDFFVHVLHFLV